MTESTASTSPRYNETQPLALWIIAAALVLLSVSVAYSTFFESSEAQIVVQPAQPQFGSALSDINHTLSRICRALAETIPSNPNPFLGDFQC